MAASWSPRLRIAPQEGSHSWFTLMVLSPTTESASLLRIAPGESVF